MTDAARCRAPFSGFDSIFFDRFFCALFAGAMGRPVGGCIFPATAAMGGFGSSESVIFGLSRI